MHVCHSQSKIWRLVIKSNFYFIFFQSISWFIRPNSFCLLICFKPCIQLKVEKLSQLMSIEGEQFMRILETTFIIQWLRDEKREKNTWQDKEGEGREFERNREKRKQTSPLFSISFLTLSIFIPESIHPLYCQVTFSLHLHWQLSCISLHHVLYVLQSSLRRQWMEEGDRIIILSMQS